MNRLVALIALIFHLPATHAFAVTIETVFVGNPGNAPDWVLMSNDGTTGYGSVGYPYRIGATEVTSAQYAEFLNAKATHDVLGLFHSEMLYSGIVRSGAPGNYIYSVVPEQAKLPIGNVSWFDAIRFVNWLHNGQGNGDTESGAYTLLGGTPTPSNSYSVVRNPDAIWFLPTEDEWYKAAYHKNDGPSGNYFSFATSSNSRPISEAPPGGPNSANYGFRIPGATHVGAYTNSKSPYGTFDMSGNVAEFNEAVVHNSYRGVRGGFSVETVAGIASSYRGFTDPSTQSGALGFRVATVPEPNSWILGASAILVFGCVKRRGGAGSTSDEFRTRLGL